MFDDWDWTRVFEIAAGVAIATIGLGVVKKIVS